MNAAHGWETPSSIESMLRNMYRIRFFEEAAQQSYYEDLTTGPLHLYVGEEAVAVGACSTLRPTDYVTSTHRGHGHCIAKGGDLKRMMAELLQRETGYCKGRGGSMHLADPARGILVSSGIVGGGIPISLGAAFSAQYTGTDQVTLCFFSDGASNQGSFHESVNLAALWKLPVVFVCENNGYAITTAATRSLPIKDVADRAAAYGIPGTITDGMDVRAVYEAVAPAVARARAGDGPSLVECKTYRFLGHWVGDPIVYRTEEEVEDWRKRDPIVLLRQWMQTEGSWKEVDLDAIRDEVAREVAAAVAFAKASAFPAAARPDPADGDPSAKTGRRAG